MADLNPHQIDAALFALRSPFTNGAILADEVGLGKTVEAGIVASQKWAERRRRILISLVVNFDLPWNPQRIEQRIGRCHRYGQEHDIEKQLKHTSTIQTLFTIRWTVR